jgi:hypothetical protein
MLALGDPEARRLGAVDLDRSLREGCSTESSTSTMSAVDSKTSRTSRALAI